MRKWLIAVGLVLVFSGVVYARNCQLDRKCYNDCVKAGYRWNACRYWCTYCEGSEVEL